MEFPADPARPFLVPTDGPPPVPGEARELATLARAGIELAPAAWVPAAAEESFYRWNHLPTRLASLFAPVASHDPDEDDIEDVAAEARALIEGHALLDVWVDAFYDAVASLPARVRVRRPGRPGREAARGRPALLALRSTWAEAWSDAAVLSRLRATGSVALEAAPTLVQQSADASASEALARRVRAALDHDGTVRADERGRVTRLGSAARPEAVASEG